VAPQISRNASLLNDRLGGLNGSVTHFTGSAIFRRVPTKAQAAYFFKLAGQLPITCGQSRNERGPVTQGQHFA
jgi:hypothetical protein